MWRAIANAVAPQHFAFPHVGERKGRIERRRDDGIAVGSPAAGRLEPHATGSGTVVIAGQKHHVARLAFGDAHGELGALRRKLLPVVGAAFGVKLELNQSRREHAARHHELWDIELGHSREPSIECRHLVRADDAIAARLALEARVEGEERHAVVLESVTQSARISHLTVGRRERAWSVPALMREVEISRPHGGSVPVAFRAGQHVVRPAVADLVVIDEHIGWYTAGKAAEIFRAESVVVARSVFLRLLSNVDYSGGGIRINLVSQHCDEAEPESLFSCACKRTEGAVRQVVVELHPRMPAAACRKAQYGVVRRARRAYCCLAIVD